MWYDITKKQWFMEVCMKKIISILLFVLLTASFLITVSACTVIYKSEPLPDREKYTGPYSEVNGAFAGTDDLDRELTTDNSTYAENEKTVYFIFYGKENTARTVPMITTKLYKPTQTLLIQRKTG